MKNLNYPNFQTRQGTGGRIDYSCRELIELAQKPKKTTPKPPLRPFFRGSKSFPKMASLLAKIGKILAIFGSIGMLG